MKKERGLDNQLLAEAMRKADEWIRAASEEDIECLVWDVLVTQYYEKLERAKAEEFSSLP